MIIDSTAQTEETTTEGGDQDVAQDSTNTQANQNESVQSGATVPDGGTEAGEVEANVGPQDGEVEAEADGTEPGVEEQSPAFDPAAFKQELVNELKESFAPQSQAPQLTEEQWALKEQEYGVPRSAIQAFTRQNVQVVQTLRQEFAQMLDARFAKIEKDGAIKGMSSKFADVGRFKAGMDEFLSRYNPSLHTNPELLETAYFYARGKNGGSTTPKKTGNGPMKVAGTPRPASPSGARRPATPQLNAIQKDAAAKYGMSEAEYAQYKTGGKNVVFG